METASTPAADFVIEGRGRFEAVFEVVAQQQGDRQQKAVLHNQQQPVGTTLPEGTVIGHQQQRRAQRAAVQAVGSQIAQRQSGWCLHIFPKAKSAFAVVMVRNWYVSRHSPACVDPLIASRYRSMHVKK